MKLKNRFLEFKRQYETLVDYFADRTYKVPDYFLFDLMQLFLVLERFKINHETFLVSNFRMYNPRENFDYPYPYIRYLLNNPLTFRLYEEHHRKYGDTVGVLSYSKSVKYFREMREDCLFWLNLNGKPELEKIQTFVVNGATDIFKLYIKWKYFPILAKNKINLNFHSPEKIKKLEGIFNHSILDRIYKFQEDEFLKVV